MACGRRRGGESGGEKEKQNVSKDFKQFFSFLYFLSCRNGSFKRPWMVHLNNNKRKELTLFLSTVCLQGRVTLTNHPFIQQTSCKNLIGLTGKEERPEDHQRKPTSYCEKQPSEKISKRVMGGTMHGTPAAEHLSRCGGDGRTRGTGGPPTGNGL